MTGPIKAIWLYRGFILGSVKREFQSRYVNSLLGAGWSVLSPFSMILVYTVVLSNVMQVRMPGVDSTLGYGVYLCAGILPWSFFSEIVTKGQGVFLENANLIKKLNFPRICLPTVVVLGAGINFAIVLSLFLVFLVAVGLFPGWVVWALVPILLLQTALAIGLGVMLGVLNVFFRDTAQLFAIVFQFWFWLTPIVYPVTALPANLRDALLVWNPMAPLVEAYQEVILRAREPDWTSLWVPTLCALAACLAGRHMFRSRAGELVDEL